MTEIERIFQRSPDPADFVRAWLDHVRAVLERIDPAQVAAFAQALDAARRAGGTVHLLGNGGSAATASHLANDLLALPLQPPMRVWCLADSAPVLTARGNDLGYDQVYAAQLRGRLGPADVVVAISASGRSPNVLAAVQVAREAGARTVGLCGFDGGALLAAVDVPVLVPTGPREYGPVEGLHSVLGHAVANYLALAGAR